MKKTLLFTIISFFLFANAEAACSVTVTASGPTTFCTGDSVVLTGVPTGTGPFLYSWSNGQGGNPITVKVSGTYTITIIDASSCSATSAPVVVTVNPLPIVTA